MDVADRPTDVIATAFAFAAFAVALISSAAAGRPTTEALFLALVAMVIARAVGGVIGAAAEVATREHIATHEAAHPIADVELALSDVEELGDDAARAA
ncbi:MAG: hypothetical protein AAF138_11470 [Planctomycetota bacterium]